MNTYGWQSATLVLLLAAACTPVTKTASPDEQSRASVSPPAKVRPTFTSLRHASDYYDEHGFILLGQFVHGTWPAKAVYEKEADNEINFVLKNGQSHGYPGYIGYHLKVVAFEDASGGETMLVFRSKEKKPLK